jgi:drug/metabolite transporter (DMT)-like permease
MENSNHSCLRQARVLSACMAILCLVGFGCAAATARPLEDNPVQGALGPVLIIACVAFFLLAIFLLMAEQFF